MRGIQNNILRCRGAFLEQDPLDTAHKARYVGEKIKRDTQAKKLVAVSRPKTDDTADLFCHMANMWKTMHVNVCYRMDRHFFILNFSMYHLDFPTYRALCAVSRTIF
ncbi:hypothetical protein FOLKNPGA_00035 [Legionella sp. PC1000]|nr:hypothetical protein FOLKNPGA_00035 [Legionella sp. PC1000]